MDGYSELMQEDCHRYILNQTTVTPQVDTKYITLLRWPVSPSGYTSNVSEGSKPLNAYYTDPLVEVPVGSYNYARVGKASGDWTSPTTTSDTFITESSNIAAITFNESTASWGLIKSFLVVGAATGSADIYFGGNLDNEKDIQVDTIAVFAANNLKLQTKNTNVY